MYTTLSDNTLTLKHTHETDHLYGIHIYNTPTHTHTHNHIPVSHIKTLLVVSVVVWPASIRYQHARSHETQTLGRVRCGRLFSVWRRVLPRVDPAHAHSHSNTHTYTHEPCRAVAKIIKRGDRSLSAVSASTHSPPPPPPPPPRVRCVRV